MSQFSGYSRRNCFSRAKVREHSFGAFSSGLLEIWSYGLVCTKKSKSDVLSGLVCVCVHVRGACVRLCVCATAEARRHSRVLGNGKVSAVLDDGPENSVIHKTVPISIYLWASLRAFLLFSDLPDGIVGWDPGERPTLRNWTDLFISRVRRGKATSKGDGH